MPLQLVSVDESGQLDLQKSVLYRCFLHERILEYPVYLISVIGERRTGKSFLLNYLMKALHSQETAGRFDLGAEDEILEGFPWKPGTEKVTNGIWIWSKPFILERNRQKVAVFLLDTEGSMDMKGERNANINMCMLTLILSSHLVLNVNSNIKETDVDYLEIYCNGIDIDQLQNLKSFDFLIRNWYDPKKCTEDDAKSYLNGEIKMMKNKYKDCNFFKIVNERSINCFLMPHPGNDITSKETGRLQDMNKEFQDNLKTYLSGVVERIMCSIGSASNQNTRKCGAMPEQILLSVNHINNLKCNISSPAEMCNMIKNMETMQEIKEEFQEFLRNWPLWKLRIGTQVADKIEELRRKFETSFSFTNEEDRNEQREKMTDYLVIEGNNFCRNHKVKLILHGVPVLVSVAGLAAAGPAGALFASQASTSAAAGSSATEVVISGAAAVGQIALSVLRKWI
ncbi:RING finger protein 112-like isoform X2 [Engystomops pustulosus]|uniref:RING finger protein 112-like isoform X2 n=1 Tax=Engystomops pustulosus TaxID=76066 RepID=UPI003AFB1220